MQYYDSRLREKLLLPSPEDVCSWLDIGFHDFSLTLTTCIIISPTVV